MSGDGKKKGNVAQRVWDMALPLAQELGLTLWDVQFVKEARTGTCGSSSTRKAG